MHERNARVREIIEDREWTSSKVAGILGVKISTVNSWRANTRNVSQTHLDMLERAATREREALGI
jgi:DNA-binding transcriptional regulator YdaS (Cro superfamily)